MGTCIDKLPHSCGTRKGLQVFEKEGGGYDGFCFSCKTFVPDPYEDKPEGWKPPPIHKKTPEEIQAELDEIEEYVTVDIPHRMLKKATLERYGIKIGLSEADGVTPDSAYFPVEKDGKVTGYKVKLFDPKKLWTVGDVKNPDLFGWSQAVKTGAKTLYITEGEFDAAALFQILKDGNAHTKYAEFDPAVVSIPFGSSSAGPSLSRLYDKIKAVFKDIVLVFDQDDAGRKAVDDVVRLYPDIKTASLPAKDANECLVSGRSKAAFKAVLFNAEQPKNTRLVLGSSLREKARQQPEWGFSWPWEKMTKDTRGIRLGETIYIGAGVKMGKSEVVNALAAHLITEHKWKVFMAKPEEANRKTYQLLVGKVAGRIFHDPNIPFDYDAYDKAEPLIGDNAIMVNLYQHLGWETLKADIKAAVALGAKAVIIDPITNLTNQMGSAEANEALVAIASELAAMAMDLNIVVFIFCHLKAPTNGEPHERGGKVLSTQFAGSRAMMRSCHYMIGIEGNKDPDLPNEERNIRTLVILEDREFGVSSSCKLYWDSKTGLFNEMRGGY